MNYHNITKEDMNNGDGLRVVLWVAGCEHNCPGCHNPQTHDPNSGILCDDTIYDELYSELKKDYIDGITYSGGDPLHPNNVACISGISELIKYLFPDKTQWLYTGYKFERILELSKNNNFNFQKILNNVDVIVDGRFHKELSSPDKPWVGSSNQRVINVKESIKQEKIVIHNQ